MTHSRPLRVAFMTDAPRVAGSELWLLDQLPLLRAQGIESTLFLSPSARLDELARRLEAAGVAVERVASPNEWPARTAAFDLRVMQAWSPNTYRRVLPRLASPRVVVSHDQLDFHYPQPVRAMYRETYPWTKARPFRAADRVVTVSGWAGEFMRTQMGLPGAVAVRNGVDAEKFRPVMPEERARLRAGFGFTRFTVVVPGRFAPEKNQLAAVRAARHAPNLDFVFVGDMDSGTGKLASVLGRRRSNVRFLGRRWDMPELYRASDALLQPTLAENQSLVTLEAMASGLPIVTTPIPAQAELVQDGVTGLLVPADSRLLALALTRLAAHPERARAMGEKARAHVLARHTPSHTAELLGPILREAARPASPS